MAYNIKGFSEFSDCCRWQENWSNIIRSKTKELATLQKIRNAAWKSCSHDSIMPDPKSTLNFHLGIKFWSQWNAYKTREKLLNLEIDKKIDFSRVTWRTLKFAHKWTKRNIKKISPLSHAEFYHLSGVFIRFCIKVIMKRKVYPTSEAGRGKFLSRNTLYYKENALKLCPWIALSSILFFQASTTFTTYKNWVKVRW